MRRTRRSRGRKKTSEGTYCTFGNGGSWLVRTATGLGVYVTGQVILNAPAMEKTAALEGLAIIQATSAHGLAYLVGEEHVEDPAQLMNPTLSSGGGRLRSRSSADSRNWARALAHPISNDERMMKPQDGRSVDDVGAFPDGAGFA